MKQITITTLIILTSLWAFSQSKFQAGVYAEGGYFFPKSTYSQQDIGNNLATGAGIFGSYDISQKLSVLLGAGYRYKSNNANSIVYTESNGHGGYGYDSGYETIKRTYNQHYFAIPLKLRYLLSEKLFVEAGIETALLLNYDKVTDDQLSDDTNAPYHDFLMEKIEYDWIVGFGYKLSPKLNVSLNYTQGFDDQGMGSIKNLNESYGQRYKNRMLMLTISYSIFN